MVLELMKNFLLFKESEGITRNKELNIEINNNSSVEVKQELWLVIGFRVIREGMAYLFRVFRVYLGNRA